LNGGLEATLLVVRRDYDRQLNRPTRHPCKSSRRAVRAR
jgi:hypothetical protein